MPWVDPEAVGKAQGSWVDLEDCVTKVPLSLSKFVVAQRNGKPTFGRFAMPFRVLLLTPETNYLVARAKTASDIKIHLFLFLIPSSWIQDNLLGPIEGLEPEEAIHFLKLKFESLAHTEVLTLIV